MKYLKKFENFDFALFDKDEENEEWVKDYENEDQDQDEENELYNELVEKKSTTYKKSGLKNPKKADLNKDGKISDYESKRGKAIEKSIQKEKKDDKKEESKELTAAQKKLPEGLRKAIEAKKKKK